MDSKKYLIADARREQIIKSAIEVLMEIGYLSTTLSKIAKKAKVSTGLISYHFSDKEDLMKNTLMYLVEQERAYIKGEVVQKQTYIEKLVAFIEASFVYHRTHRANSIALLEIIFNARMPDNTPYYRAEIHEEDELNTLLKEILTKGQQAKEFNDCDAEVIATIIRGAITTGAMSLPQNQVRAEDHCEKMIQSILKMIK